MKCLQDEWMDGWMECFETPLIISEVCFFCPKIYCNTILSKKKGSYLLRKFQSAKLQLS